MTAVPLPDSLDRLLKLADPQPLVERLVSEFERLQPLARMMSTQD